MAVPRTLDAQALAKVLHRSVATVKADANRRPHTLPPRLRIPGSPRMLWLEADVEAWLQRCRDAAP